MPATRPTRRRRPPANRGSTLPECLRDTVRDWLHNLVVTAAVHPRWQSVAHSHAVEPVAVALLEPTATKRALAAEQKGSQRTGFAESLARYARHHAGTARAPAEVAAPVLDNLDLLTRLLKLGETDRACLLFGAVFAVSTLGASLDSFAELIGLRGRDVLACALQRPRHEVSEAACDGGRLARLGLMGPELDGPSQSLTIGFEVSTRLCGWLLEDRLTEESVLRGIVPCAPPPTLDWAAHAPIEKEGRYVRALLHGALERGARGIHVLIHGRSGTGKTELARLLAQDLGVPLHACGREDAQGKSPSATERLSSLLLGHRLLAGRPGLLLFDEIEDLFEAQWSAGRGHSARGSASKAWLNELLEESATPTLWTSNRIDHLDPAILRRFTYVLEMPPIGVRQRTRILNRELAGDAQRGPAFVERLASRYDASPAQLVGAVRAARLVSSEETPDPADIECALAASVRATLGPQGIRRHAAPPEGYLLEALNGPVDLEATIERLVAWTPRGEEGLTVCLYGLPGTGKSALARYLAWRMGRPVVERHASDLLDCYVGETEKRIAAAFQEAEADGALLLFDEVDSFLRPRAQATRSWEATQTNEFLTRLESARGLVVCTTNEWAGLDPAALRRFVFKLELRPLRPPQAARMFESILGPWLSAPLQEDERPALESAMRRLTLVTPGDLAAVRRRVAALGVRLDMQALLAEVAAEVAHKEGARAPMGFGRATNEPVQRQERAAQTLSTGAPCLAAPHRGDE